VLYVVHGETLGWMSGSTYSHRRAFQRQRDGNRVSIDHREGGAAKAWRVVGTIVPWRILRGKGSSLRQPSDQDGSANRYRRHEDT
jgi:hypothetical protein